MTKKNHINTNKDSLFMKESKINMRGGRSSSYCLVFRDLALNTD